jgi:hypothetical protein
MSLKVALVLALGWALGARAQDVSAFCREFGRTNASNASGLQVTREISKTDYVIKGKFKSIHCCAKGYRSIEW